jgi:hypothetical protein
VIRGGVTRGLRGGARASEQGEQQRNEGSHGLRQGIRGGCWRSSPAWRLFLGRRVDRAMVLRGCV